MMTDRLNCDSVTVKARYFNFGDGYPEQWDFVRSLYCDACDDYFVSGCGDAQEGEECPNADCDGKELIDEDDGPMMNYFWPLPDFDGNIEEAAQKLNNAHVALCLVWTLDEYEAEEYGLALTGGGMNLSWDICRAYMVLGFMPPLAACDLPDFAGMDFTNEENKKVVEACKESAQVSISWANSTLSKLEGLGK